jgi:phosphatidylinositol kinase/protein kinase (PI-3  family)
MGGSESDDYKRFLDICAQAFNILRKNAFLIINLLAMMVSAGMEWDIVRDSAVEEVGGYRICSGQDGAGVVRSASSRKYPSGHQGIIIL